MSDKASFKIVLIPMLIVGLLLAGPGLYLVNVTGSWFGWVLLAIAGIIAFIQMAMGGFGRGFVALLAGLICAYASFWLLTVIFGTSHGIR